jgi:hypothetical protein
MLNKPIIRRWAQGVAAVGRVLWSNTFFDKDYGSTCHGADLVTFPTLRKSNGKRGRWFSASENDLPICFAIDQTRKILLNTLFFGPVRWPFPTPALLMSPAGAPVVNKTKAPNFNCDSHQISFIASIIPCSKFLTSELQNINASISCATTSAIIYEIVFKFEIFGMPATSDVEFLTRNLKNWWRNLVSKYLGRFSCRNFLRSTPCPDMSTMALSILICCLIWPISERSAEDIQEGRHERT